LRTAQKIAAGALILAFGATAYGIFLLGRASVVSAKRQAAASEDAVVDQTPFKAAEDLAQLADSNEEKEIAKNVLRLTDRELDLSFAIALQDAEAHPPDLSAEAKAIQQDLQKKQKLQQALEAQVDQLTAQAAKASGQRKADLEDQLVLAKASRDVADNDVDDANRDLTEAGGNQRERIEKMKESHEAADKARKDPDKIFPAPPEEKLGLIHRFQQWSALNNKRKLLQSAKSEADILVASLTEQHNALAAQLDAEKFNSPDLAAHSKLAQQSSPDSGTASADSAIAAITGTIAKSRSAEEKKSVLATTKSITLDQQNLANLDKRVDSEK
jgi:hypothetical protein